MRVPSEPTPILPGSMVPQPLAPSDTTDIPPTPLILPPPVSEELVQAASLATGQTVVSANNRFRVDQRRLRHKKLHGLSEIEWITYLFGNFSEEESETSEEEATGFQFFSDQICQGSIADCFLIAVMYVLLKNRAFGKMGFASLIDRVQILVPTKQEGGTIVFESRPFFEVVFPGYPDHPLYVEFEDLAFQEQVEGGIGFRVLERAFAQLSQKLSLCTAEMSVALDETFSSINGGGDCTTAFYTLTGSPGGCLRRIDTQTKEPNPQFEQELYHWIQQILQQPMAYMLVASTNGNSGEYRDPAQKFPCWHAYAIDLCHKSGQITVINPWNTLQNRHTLSVQDFVCCFDRLYWLHVDDLG